MAASSGASCAHRCGCEIEPIAPSSTKSKRVGDAEARVKFSSRCRTSESLRCLQTTCCEPAGDFDVAPLLPVNEPQNLTGQSCSLPRELAAACAESCRCTLENSEASTSPVRCSSQSQARCILDKCCTSNPSEPNAPQTRLSRQTDSRNHNKTERPLNARSHDTHEQQDHDEPWRTIAAELRPLSAVERRYRIKQLTAAEEAGLRNWLLRQRRDML